MNFLMYLVLEHEVSKIYIKSTVLRILIDIEQRAHCIVAALSA